MKFSNTVRYEGRMSKPTEIFTSFLKDRNLQCTKQRKDIVSSFIGAKRHLSVDDLYDIVRKRNDDVGHTTVFRTLKLLCESGVAKEINFGDKIKRYEVASGHGHHDHLVCLKCGKVVEAMDLKIRKLQDAMCSKFEFESVQCGSTVYGYCKRCKK